MQKLSPPWKLVGMDWFIWIYNHCLFDYFWRILYPDLFLVQSFLSITSYRTFYVDALSFKKLRAFLMACQSSASFQYDEILQAYKKGQLWPVTKSDEALVKQTNVVDLESFKTQKNMITFANTFW